MLRAIRRTLQLAKAIGAKHRADGANSPLKGLGMDDMESKTTEAGTQNQNAAKLYRDAELATQNRDNALGTDNPVKCSVAYYVRAVRDMLLGLHKGNEQKLGDWGSEVDYGPRSCGTKPPAPPVTEVSSARVRPLPRSGVVAPAEEQHGGQSHRVDFQGNGERFSLSPGERAEFPRLRERERVAPQRRVRVVRKEQFLR